MNTTFKHLALFFALIACYWVVGCIEQSADESTEPCFAQCETGECFNQCAEDRR